MLTASPSRQKSSLRTWVVLRASVILLALSLAPLLRAQGRAECASIESAVLSRPVRYCAFLPDSFDQDKTRQYPVLYYLLATMSSRC